MFERDTRSIGESVVSEYLWWRGMDRVDYILATHADADHIDGLNDVARNFKVMAMEGRIVQIAFQQASKIEIDLLPIMLKRLTFTGSTLRPRSVAQKAEIARDLEAKVWPLLEDGKCRPVIHTTFPLADAAAAHRMMESSVHTGKIILTL